MNFKPIEDWVFVEPMKYEDEVTESGIIVPAVKKAQSKKTGRVVAVGPGKRTKRGIVPPDVKVGDLVEMPEYAVAGRVTVATIDGKEYVVLRADEILGVYETA